MNALQLHGGVPTKAFPKGRPLSDKRSHAAASLLYTCLADAVRMDHLPKHPMADGRVVLLKRINKEPAVLDPVIFNKLLDVTRGTRLYPFIVIDGASGCRRGELCANVRTGGTYRFVFSHASSEQPMSFFGRYVEVTPHSRLVWTNDEGDEGGAVTTVTFEERGGETLVVMHDLYPSKKALDDAIASGSTSGTGEQFEQLDQLLVDLGASVGRS